MFRPRSALLRVVVPVVVLTLSVVGCADSKKPVTTSGSAGPTTTFDFPKDEIVDQTGKPIVEIKAVDNSFEPRYVEVTAGTRVLWRNEGRNNHDVLPSVDGAFPAATAAQMPSGATHEVTFNTAGDFPYYCSLHGTPKNGMNGAIRVVPKA